MSAQAQIAREHDREVHVAFRGVSKTYDGQTPAVADLDLEVREGEFLTLLGPSGSGKTTTLMMLAGFEQADRGAILLRGESLSHKPPHRRNMGVVFQNYALFPHMSVAGNLAFPLRVRGIRGKAADARVRALLELVHLDDLGDRRPLTLSGGQQQRVALARALIFEPDLVLMDEPLGALDRQLRETLQGEIKRIHRQLGVTLVYVTHDQSEALMLSDRIAIFAGGRLQQVGAPQSIYEKPANAFVAGFVGDNNLIDGVVTEMIGGYCIVHTAGGVPVRARPMGSIAGGSIAGGSIAVGSIAAGGRVRIAIRPQQIVIGSEARKMDNCFEASISEQDYHGDHGRIRALLSDGTEIVVRSPGRSAATSPITIGWPADVCRAYATSSGAE